MPKIKVDFNLPEEREEFLHYFNGGKYYLIITDFENFLRNKLKYEDLSDEVYSVIEMVQKEFYGLLEEENVDTMGGY